MQPIRKLRPYGNGTCRSKGRNHERFESKFVSQGPYQSRTIFESLDLAWSILRAFPKELLKKIPKKDLDKYYARRAAAKEDFNKADGSR